MKLLRRTIHAAQRRPEPSSMTHRQPAFRNQPRHGRNRRPRHPHLDGQRRARARACSSSSPRAPRSRPPHRARRLAGEGRAGADRLRTRIAENAIENLDGLLAQPLRSRLRSAGASSRKLAEERMSELPEGRRRRPSTRPRSPPRPAATSPSPRSSPRSRPRPPRSTASPRPPSNVASYADAGVTAASGTAKSRK